MTLNNDPIATEWRSAIESYESAIQVIELEAPNISEEQALKVLLARDLLEELLADKTQLSEQQLLASIELDERLQKQEEAIAAAVDLAKSRKTLKPPESSWWWLFQTAKEVDAWDRFDWFWNLLTAAALGLGGSYMFITLQAFAVGGLGVAEAFGTIAQATGLALLGKGALTSRGHKQVETLLDKIGISPKFYSEATCAASILLMLAIYGIHTNLPNFLHRRGLAEYNAGRLGDAEEKFLQAIQLNPRNSEFYVPLGLIYESIGDFDRALAQYKDAVADGDPRAFNAIGRVYISRLNPLTKRPQPALAETYLRAGLQRVENDKTKYQLRRNLGWALLSQKKYAQAQEELEAAIALDTSITEDQIGGGMAFCFLAQSFTEQGNFQQAEENWLKCLDKGRPETVSEYRWFIQIGQGYLASCLDTSGITVGADDKLTKEKLAEFCQKDKILKSIEAAAIEFHKVSEINDPPPIQALRDKLYNEFNAAWDEGIPESNAVYNVFVDKDGKIQSYKAVDSLAEEFAINTGLEELVDDNADGQVTKFEVVFTNQGELDVKPVD